MLCRVLRLAGGPNGPNTGGMVALLPDELSAHQLTVQHPNATAPDKLHLTLAYLGDNVTNMAPLDRHLLLVAAAQHAEELPPVTARVFGHALFNPDGGADGTMTPCATYLVGDNATPSDRPSDLSMLHNNFRRRAAVPQRSPFVPHITAGFGVPANKLVHTGPVRFDRLRVSLAGEHHTFPFTGTAHRRG